MQLEPQHGAAASGAPAPSQPVAPAEQLTGSAQALPAAEAEPAEPVQTDAAVSVAAAAAGWEPPAIAFADEWGLSLEQQQQQPFRPPDPADLQCPAPVIFDFETNGGWVVGRCAAGLHRATLEQAAACNGIGALFTPPPPPPSCPRCCDADRPPTTALVVEVAALDAESDSSFNSMVKLPPGAAMSAGATSVNKLTTHYMQQPHHPQFDTVYSSFLEFLSQRTQAAGQGGYLLLIGHNIASEQRAHMHYLQPSKQLSTSVITTIPSTLCLTLAHALLPAPSICAEFDLPILLRHAQEGGYPQLRHARYLDTYILARAVLPRPDAGGPPNYTLAALYEFYTGTVPVGNHRAAADCEFAREVLVHLVRCMQLPGAGLPGGTVGRACRGNAAAK